MLPNSTKDCSPWRCWGAGLKCSLSLRKQFVWDLIYLEGFQWRPELMSTWDMEGFVHVYKGHACCNDRLGSIRPHLGSLQSMCVYMTGDMVIHEGRMIHMNPLMSLINCFKKANRVYTKGLQHYAVLVPFRKHRYNFAGSSYLGELLFDRGDACLTLLLLALPAETQPDIKPRQLPHQICCPQQ